MAQEQSQRSSALPGLVSMTTISVLESTYRSEPTWRLWSGPSSTSFHFFFFFFWVGQGGGSAADNMTSQRGEVVSRPHHLAVLWSGAPSSGTACSLELSLPSHAGIWFKTLLPVGGTNTAPLATVHKSELVSRHSGVADRDSRASEARSVGVANGRSDCGIPTKPAGGLLSDIGDDDPCLQLTGHTLPDRPEVV